MFRSPIDARAVAESGLQALRAGDPQSARARFEQLVAAGVADASVWLASAHASHMLDQPQRALTEVNEALRLEPQNLGALLFKADQHDAMGEGRVAASYYSAAVSAGPPLDKARPDVAAELRRAAAKARQYLEEYETYLRDQLQLPPNAVGRFAESLDLMVGRKTVYLQQPTVYYFPGLPQTSFYSRDDHPWVTALEAETDAIRAELLQVLQDEGAFRPYLEKDPNRPAHDSYGLLDNPAWSAFYLIKWGDVIEANAARCPATMRAMAGVPLCGIQERAPQVLFSLLRPGAHIPPHTGNINTRLICHLPLIVPNDCTLRVGNEVRPWRTGEVLIFDDTIEHEAWNRSDQTRVVLLFDVWRPELSEDDRRQVNALFAAIQAYGGEVRPWSD